MMFFYIVVCALFAKGRGHIQKVDILGQRSLKLDATESTLGPPFECALL